MSKFKVGDKLKLRDNFHPYKAGQVLTVVNLDTASYYPVTEAEDGGRVCWIPEILRSLTDPVCDFTSPHYTPDASGKDYLARCEETYSRDEMIGAYRFTIGKYVDRMGKKQGEPVEKELDKIIDYATRAKRWLERQS